MLRLLRAHLTYANVVATLALFVALGGASYAAFKLPARSVGTRELKDGAVTKAKLNRRTLAALAGRRGPTGPAGPTGATGPAGAPGQTGPSGAVGGTLPSGATITGIYFADTQAATDGTIQWTPISFGYKVLGTINVQIVPQGTTPPAACPGTAADPAARPGWMCIFEAHGSNPSAITIIDPVRQYGDVGRTGVIVYTYNGTWSEGTWAVTAP